MTAIAWQRSLNEAFTRAGADIVLEQWVILVNLQHHNDVVQGSLADMLMRDKSFMTRIVDDLESRGLVQRRRDPSDRRCWRIHLTKTGNQFVNGLMDLVVQTSRQAESGLSKAQLDSSRTVLRRMFLNLTGSPVDSCLPKAGEPECEAQ